MLKLKSGTNVLKNGGIYQEIGSRGGLRENHCAISDNKILPPTTRKGHFWLLKKKTPDSKRR